MSEGDPAQRMNEGALLLLPPVCPHTSSQRHTFLCKDVGNDHQLRKKVGTSKARDPLNLEGMFWRLCQPSAAGALDGCVWQDCSIIMGVLTALADSNSDTLRLRACKTDVMVTWENS